MATEKALYQRLRGQLSDYGRLVRFETDMSLGIPDVWFMGKEMGDFTWVELKVGELRDSDHMIKLSHPVSFAQYDFIKDCARSGCPATVVIGITRPGLGWWRYGFVYDPETIRNMVGVTKISLSDILHGAGGLHGRVIVTANAEALLDALRGPPLSPGAGLREWG